jgi:exonuclease SbcC
MIINRIRVSGFKVIGNELDISFPEEGKVGIIGHNESGKSSLLEAIEIGLFGLQRGAASRYNRKNLVTWGKSKAEILLDFRSGGERYLLQRTIHAKSGHDVKLWQIDEGSNKKKQLTSTTTESDQYVERITGMDRDSFTKLVFIKQKDLDALKDLSKSNREKMTNKVMGIEVFDYARKLAKEESGELTGRKDLEVLKLSELESKVKSYRDAEKGLEEILEKLPDKERRMEDFRKKLDEVKSQIEIQEWLRDNEILRENLQRVRNDLNGIKTDHEKYARLEIELEAQRERLHAFDGIEEKLKSLRKLKESRSAISDLKQKKSEEENRFQLAREEENDIHTLLKQHEEPWKKIERSLPKFEAVETEADKIADRLEELKENEEKYRDTKGLLEPIAVYRERRRTALITTIILMALGILSILFAILLEGMYIRSGAIFATLLLWIVSAFAWKRYSDIDSTIAAFHELETIEAERDRLKSEDTVLGQKLASLRDETGFSSYEEVTNALEAIVSNIKQETGVESVPQLDTLLTEREKDKEELQVRLSEIEDDLSSLQDEIEKLDPLTDGLEVDDAISRCEVESNSKQKLEERVDQIENQVKEFTGRDFDKEIEAGEKKVRKTEGELESHEEKAPDQAKGDCYSEQTLSECKEEEKKLQADISELIEQTTELRTHRDNYQETLNRLEGCVDKLNELKGQISDMEKEIEITKRVENELRNTASDLRDKVLPAASIKISQILPHLTNRRYDKLTISPDLKFKVYSEEAGSEKERDVFSGGTQDQFLIALRLAFTESILDSRVGADEYFILMDECISSSDEIRRAGIFEVLDLMSKTFKQTLVVAHEDVSNLVDHHLVLQKGEKYTEVRSQSW